MANITIAPADTLSLPAATRIASRIREYWRQRGFVLRTRVEPEKRPGYERLWVVRSDILPNGWPPVRLPVVSAAL